mmetsp:Transcript_8718/g.16919  ORF Transcript_8718/g.16919 Transcript_8718/m.16919 type:complete len:94 (+) Transcript_8718:331-612(+)
MNWIWLVTKMRVFPLSPLHTQFSKTSLPTCASSAEKGSSSRYTSQSAYTARAMLTRCFCPPERLMPLSPISVWSPATRFLRSFASPDIFTARW